MRWMNEYIHKLTKHEYYTNSGMNKKCKAQTANWEKQIKEAEFIFTQQSPKTSRGDIWDQYLANHIEVYHELWEQKTKLRWGQARFRVYRLKRRVLDLW